MPEDANKDQLVKNAAELVAATHVADDRHVGGDHAQPFVARGQLAHHAQAATVHPVHLHGGGGDHVDSPFRSTFMKLVIDSGVESSPKTYLQVRHGHAVTGHAAEVAASAVRESLLVLRLSSYRDGASPVTVRLRLDQAPTLLYTLKC